jgi:dCMP deaminase
MTRPHLDEYFMDIAKVVARRSTCIRRQIGAVIVNPDNMIIATGYNGAPRGMKHCLDLGCLRDKLSIASGTQQQICRAVHAEQNAIIQATGNGKDLRGSTMYCLVSPCVICAKLIINAGIKEIVFTDEYTEALGWEMLAEARVSLRRFTNG